MEKIKLVKTNDGIGRITAEDTYGNSWIEFTVDYLAEEETGTCSECGERMESGMLLMDGGEEFCWGCVEFVDEFTD